MIYIYYFKSWSGDEYFMKSKTKEFNKFQAKEFCKKYIPDEYEAWRDNGFKYEDFRIFETEPKEPVKLTKAFGEYYLIIPSDIKRYNKAYFTDYYCPDIYSLDGCKL